MLPFISRYEAATIIGCPGCSPRRPYASFRFHLYLGTAFINGGIPNPSIRIL